MAFRSFNLIFLMVFTIISCSNEEEEDAKPNNSNNTQGEPFKIEATGDTSFTLEGKAAIPISEFNTDTSLTIILTSSTNSALGGSIGLEVPSGAYQAQTIPVDASFGREKPYATLGYALTQGGTLPELLGISGSLEITDAAQGQFIEGALQMKGVIRPEKKDTVNLTGTFKAPLVE